MDDFAGVGMLDTKSQRADQLGRFRCGPRPAGKVLLEVAALDKFHGEIRPALVLADLVELDDIGMAHARRRFHLDAKAGAFLWAGQGAVAKEFERDQALRTHLS